MHLPPLLPPPLPLNPLQDDFLDEILDAKEGITIADASQQDYPVVFVNAAFQRVSFPPSPHSPSSLLTTTPVRPALS